MVAWATEALDAERRRAWNDARALARSQPKRGPGRPSKNSTPPPAQERARQLKGARYALWKNPEDLTERQTAKLGHRRPLGDGTQSIYPYAPHQSLNPQDASHPSHRGGGVRRSTAA